MSLDAMKQALEALDGLSEPYDILRAQNALRAAIKEAEKQEPVAWYFVRDLEKGISFAPDSDSTKSWQPLYTAPLMATEPVAWMHKHIENNIITHRPADIDRHPERWAALYTAPPPCPTCEALARSVMMDQTSHDMAPRQWQGLTDEERHGIREWQRIQTELGPEWAPMLRYLYDAIEAKLKEKNT